MGVDKPFSCDVSGCGMSFTNEDHLTVHRKKHEMCLTLNSESSSRANNMTLFVDQTPTPTRFIRNCEEVGLFQDLQTVNPFDEHFRKATESVKLGHPPIVGSINVSHDGDILNTPSVLVSDLEDDVLNPLESGPTPQLTLEDDDSVVNNDVGIIKEDLVSDNLPKTDTISSSVPETFSLESNKPVVQLENVTSESNVQFLPPSQPITMPAITSLSATSTSSSNISVVSLPTTSLSINAGTTEAQTTAFSSTPMVHLILKLPDGSSIPVQVPTTNMQTIVEPTQSVIVNNKTSNAPSSSNSSSSKNISNIAKLKLRETLTQGENRALRTMNEQLLSSISAISNDDEIMVNVPGSNLQNKRRLGHEDNDVKRQKFLERNRAAATRCRQRRKQWVQSLESKADELAAVNQHLQNEVALLRTEVTQLKSMLLAHKDCPVTQQQQKQLAHMTATGSTTVLVNSNGKVVNSTPLGKTQTQAIAEISQISEVVTQQTTPVIYRTIMSREQAIALLTANSPESSNKKLTVKPAPVNSNNNNT